MWLTPDMIGGKFQIHDDGEWPLQGQVPIASLQDLGNAFKSATASPRFFRTEWCLSQVCRSSSGASQLSWPSVLAHMDIVLQLAEQERLKSNRPFLAFLYEELLRKSWARRAEKSDPALDIAAEAQKVDKDLLSAQDQPTSPKMADLLPGADSVISHQLAAAEAAQKQADRATKQLMETQQQLLSQSQALTTKGPGKGQGQQFSNRQLKIQKWFPKNAEWREEQQKRKEARPRR